MSGRRVFDPAPGVKAAVGFLEDLSRVVYK